MLLLSNLKGGLSPTNTLCWSGNYFYTSKILMFPISQAQELIQDFVTKTLDIQGAILTISEKIPPIYFFSSKLDRQKEKAAITNALSLIDCLKRDLNIGLVERIVERITVEGQEGYWILVACDDNLNLLVLASKDKVKGWLFLEIKRLVEKIKQLK